MIAPAIERDVLGELERIAKEGGGILTAEAVVEAARDEDSPLHASFTWDNSEAAAKWRLHQARNLIRVSVRYIQPIRGAEPVSVRAFVSLSPDRSNEGGGYRLISSVLSCKESRAQMLADALAELRVFEAKYAHLKELSKVFTASRELRAALR